MATNAKTFVVEKCGDCLTKKDLIEFLEGLPDDAKIIIDFDSCMYREAAMIIQDPLTNEIVIS